MTTLKQLTKEDLRNELDLALEKGNQRRKKALLNEMAKREEAESTELN